MNIFYEESGQFKVASVIQKNDNHYQAETPHGKRAKIKAGNVSVEFNDEPERFLENAQNEAAQMDTDLLWEACGEEEFDAATLAQEYYGHAPAPTELAATLIALYAAPAYFYKKAKGIFKAAPEETLRQALAAIERKKQQDEQMENWSQALQQGCLPAEVAADLKTILHAPDKQALTYKAFTKAAAAMKLSPYELAKQTGGVSSLAQFMLEGFELKNYPQGTGFAHIEVPALADLPEAQGVEAFSIDDESTTEVDDALSVQELDGGGKRIGIHIAAPALAVGAGSAIEKVIFQRQSTAYFPGGKITMLPDNWIAAFSLDTGEARPAVSIYFDVDEALNVSNPQTRLERVRISENLRIGAIEPHFNRQTGLDAEGEAMFAHHKSLIWLYRLALALQQKRGKYDPDAAPQYDYGIGFAEGGQVEITVRERGSPIDTLVSEMMILANSTWAQMLHEQETAGLFRVQPTGKVRMSTRSEPHIGMGVPHYGWFTSPLRRAADYINQKQLISLIAEHAEPRFQTGDSMLFAALRDFETTYAAYNDFQREMEAYWSMVYLQQQGIREINGLLLKEEVVRLVGLPLTTRATGIPLEIPPKTTVKLAVTEVDPEKQILGLNYVNAVVQA
ncbi:MAG: RNB domain-containing ribonuclease [Neisseria sp.]|uniref:ribonuclease catalytic domain-containing protein n=1 Tax=Neisseria sp. TaxID=192066 RepID=UPI0026DCCA51|nr:RNB domain-containing ribonuclease [Neisseria sp.]MDO4641315.1 RNB domain-containing ribonuclease [Neisseria sp.]